MTTRGAQVVGIDISETHVRVGREKADALMPGDRMLIAEHHPFWETMVSQATGN